jgi:hypothetical protein
MIAPKRVLPKTSLPKAALAQRRAAPDYNNLPKGPKKPLMTRGRVIALIAMLMITCVAAAWFTGLIGPDPRLAEIRDLQAKLGDQSLSDKDRRATFDEIRKKMDELPEDVRQKLWQERMNGRGQGGPRGFGGVSPSQLLAMPADKRNAELDKMLDRMVDFQKQQAARNGQGGPGGPGGPGGGPRGPGGPGGPQNQWRNRFLSSMPAENRAAGSIMRQLMQARAEQRGISMGGTR